MNIVLAAGKNSFGTLWFPPAASDNQPIGLSKLRYRACKCRYRGFL